MIRRRARERRRRRPNARTMRRGPEPGTAGANGGPVGDACATAPIDGRLGGPPGIETGSSACPAGSAVTAVSGELGTIGANPIVATVRCAARAEQPGSARWAAAKPGRRAPATSCGAGQVAVGIEGREGDFIDKLALRCRSADLTGATAAVLGFGGNGGGLDGPYDCAPVGGSSGSMARWDSVTPWSATEHPLPTARQRRRRGPEPGRELPKRPRPRSVRPRRRRDRRRLARRRGRRRAGGRMGEGRRRAQRRRSTRRPSECRSRHQPTLGPGVERCRPAADRPPRGEGGVALSARAQCVPMKGGGGVACRRARAGPRRAARRVRVLVQHRHAMTAARGS